MAQVPEEVLSPELSHHRQEMLLTKLKQEVDWTQPYAWFDPEIKDVLGIDIFAEEFDSTAGYAIVSKANTDLLLLKLEHLSECCEQAFDEFLGIKGFGLTTKNVGTKKYYSDAYKRILDRLAIPPDLLESWYSADQVQHLYDRSEIKAFIAKWSQTHTPGREREYSGSGEIPA